MLHSLPIRVGHCWQMLLSFAHVVLAVWTSIRNYEASGGQLNGSHRICTKKKEASSLVVYCSGSPDTFVKTVGIKEPDYVYVASAKSYDSK